MAPLTDHDPGYLDAEDCNEHVRDRVRALIGLPYDHDGSGGLPLRPEVAGFVLNSLCRPRSGWIRPIDLSLPVVRLKRDGTLLLWWRRGRRWLRLHVPTLDVVIASRIEEGCEITERLSRWSSEASSELDALFRWVLGDE
jgi:hypothetical protein